MKASMKTILIVPAAALLLAACASPTGDKNAESASVREETYTPIGTYLPRKKGQTANNAGTVDQTDLENMQRAGAATGASSAGVPVR